MEKILVTTEQILNTSFSTHFYVGVKSFHFQMHRLQNLVVEEGYLCFVVDYSSRSDIASVSLLSNGRSALFQILEDVR